MASKSVNNLSIIIIINQIWLISKYNNKQATKLNIVSDKRNGTDQPITEATNSKFHFSTIFYHKRGKDSCFFVFVGAKKRIRSAPDERVSDKRP